MPAPWGPSRTWLSDLVGVVARSCVRAACERRADASPEGRPGGPAPREGFAAAPDGPALLPLLLLLSLLELLALPLPPLQLSKPLLSLLPLLRSQTLLILQLLLPLLLSLPPPLSLLLALLLLLLVRHT